MLNLKLIPQKKEDLNYNQINWKAVSRCYKYRAKKKAVAVFTLGLFTIGDFGSLSILGIMMNSPIPLRYQIRNKYQDITSSIKLWVSRR